MLSKYVSSFVSNSRDEISRYVTGMSKEIEEECCAAMLHDNMNLYRLMVHAQQVEENRLRKRNREVKKETSFESGSSKSRLDAQDKPKFKKRFSYKVSCSFSNDHNDRCSSRKSQEGRNVDPPKE